MLAVFCALGHGEPLPTERGRGIGHGAKPSAAVMRCAGGGAGGHGAGRSRRGIVTVGRSVPQGEAFAAG